VIWHSVRHGFDAGGAQPIRDRARVERAEDAHGRTDDRGSGVFQEELVLAGDEPVPIVLAFDRATRIELQGDHLDAGIPERLAEGTRRKRRAAVRKSDVDCLAALTD
jgi:hypothetical protein